ncbi:uncharacterized protein LOC143293546 [Babylonia areolata]|uniref:uncharacterized protein LOC143293546 n=1 Tax=Babylonia areolata TaxID=304850 RepID=UPI003FD301D8
MMSLLALLLMVFVSVVEGVSEKKGVALGPKTYRCGDYDAFRGIAWWYDWSDAPRYHDGCNNTMLANRIPMAWGWKTGRQLQLPTDVDTVLGFNEPNHRAQANMSPQKAAQHWKEFQNQTGDRILVSPAAAPCGNPDKCRGNTVEWFDQFFANCTNCTVDYLATHGYWCSADSMMSFLGNLWNRYGLRIWLTEFSCPRIQSVQAQLTYMQAVLPRLEATHYVYRYSWFSTRIVPGRWVPQEASLLESNSSTLTELGQYYMDFGN